MKLSLLIFIRSIVYLTVPVMLLCTHSTPVSHGGGGSEVEVVGIVISSENTPSPQAQIKLIPQGYDAYTDGALGDSLIDTSDASGCYAFNNVKPGNYNVQAVQLSKRTRMLLTSIDVAGDTTFIPDGQLKQPGTIRLVSGTRLRSGHISIPGTDIAVPVGTSSNEIIIDSVPTGEIPRIEFIADSTAEIVVTDVIVESGDTTTIINPVWTGHQNIVLNTSATGADVKESVISFPVLIRLTSQNFDFSKTSGGGEDIRFTTSDGSSLFHEIEWWDSVKQQAALWVRVDSLYGNNSSQFIVMHWGNPQAANISNSTAVFDTAIGFQGIWHLANTSDFNVFDATVNSYTGISPDTALPSVADGIIGYCRRFDGVNDFITIPNTAASTLNFPENGNFTVSAWVKTDTLDGVAQLVVAKGYDQYFLRLTYFPTGSPLWEFTQFKNDDSWQTCTTTTTKSGSWMLLTGVRNGTKQIIYLNGIPVDSTPDSYKGNNLIRGTSSDISIGKLLEMIELPNDTQGYCFFKGAIDEVRIDNRARSTAWVKLCYMNQQVNDKLVIFK